MKLTLNSSMKSLLKMSTRSCSNSWSMLTEPYMPPAALCSSFSVPRPSSTSCTVMSTVPPPQSTTMYRVPGGRESWSCLLWVKTHTAHTHAQAHACTQTLKHTNFFLNISNHKSTFLYSLHNANSKSAFFENEWINTKRNGWNFDELKWGNLYLQILLSQRIGELRFDWWVEIIKAKEMNDASTDTEMWGYQIEKIQEC